MIDKEYNQYDPLHLDTDVDEHMDYLIDHMFVHYYQQLDQKYPKNKNSFFFFTYSIFHLFTLLIR